MIQTILRSISDFDLQNILDSSSSYSQIYRLLNIKNRSYYRTLLSERMKTLDLVKFDDNVNRNIHEFHKKQSTDSLLVQKSRYPRVHLKKRLIKEGILIDECSSCGQLPFWNGEVLTLQLDHINGVRDDNRLENLRMLCPNCHTQTNTYAGKRFKTVVSKTVVSKKITTCADCSVVISNKCVRCVPCANKIKAWKVRKFEVSKEELEKLIAEKPMTQIGKLFGVSDNAVRKRAKKLEILL